MPQETKTHLYGQQKLEGSSFHPKNFSEVSEIIELAFDYRGDITIEKKNGQIFEGYLFNRVKNIAEPVVELFPNSQSGQVIIRYSDIAGIAFTGEDPAFGKSWENWMKKNEEQRAAEAAKAAAEAAARGHL